MQDAYNLAMVAHLSAIEGSLPFLHFFDGFRTSHEYNQIELISDKDIKSMINYERLMSLEIEHLILVRRLLRVLHKMRISIFK